MMISIIFLLLSLPITLIIFTRQKYFLWISLIVSLVAIFLMQYQNNFQFHFYKGNWWIIFIAIIFLGYLTFVKLFKIISLKYKVNFKRNFLENFINPVSEEVFFTILILINVDSTDIFQSLSLSMYSSILFVVFHLILNVDVKYSNEDRLTLFVLSFINKILYIYSNLLFPIFIHIMFNNLNSFDLKKDISYKLFNNKFINFDYDSNQNYWISGQNGVGKTTLAKIISNKTGIVQNTNKKFVYFEQNFETKLSLEQWHEVHKKEIRMWDQILEKMVFKGKEKIPFKKLSSGQQQIFKIIKSLSINSDVIIFDEIDNSLDEKNRVLLFKTLKWCFLNLETKYIFISHRKAHNIFDNFIKVDIKKEDLWK